MSFVRRPAAPEDQQFARSVHHLAYRKVVEDQFGRWDDDEQTAYFDAAWPQHDHDIIDWQGTPCGYVAVESSDHAVHVHEVVLHPAYQNRGIGSAILIEAIAVANELHVPVELRVLQRNRAIELYQRLGFTEHGETPTHRLLRLTPDSALNSST